MKKFLLLLFLSCLIFACNIRNSGDKKDLKVTDPAAHKFEDSTTVQIIDSIYNFGKVTDGEKVEFNYRFKNSGKHPLIITAASASCGCTVPEKPDAPIQPGETGFLKVVFNSKGRVGEVHKEVTVVSNAYPGFPLLILSGEVIEAKK